MKNSNLHSAKVNKNDEFYTQIEDIEKEITKYNYGEFFHDKVIYCNCDDHEKSNFFKFFFMNYDFLGWKKLICTSYNPNGKGKIRIIEGDKNYNGILDENEYEDIELKGNGDFRSEECIEFLKQADVVVTNPPFSLFREYVAQLMEYGKKFLIIGNQNAITYKEIFPYIKNNKLWLGMSMNGSNRWFQTPNDYIVKSNAAGYKEINGKKLFFVNGVTWFTNIENSKRNEFFVPKNRKTWKYNSIEFPKYDNYDAIEVSKVADMPLDYDGVMGVPISFLYKYCPSQFEIIDAREIAKYEKQKNKSTYLIKDGDSSINGKSTYARIAIRKKSF